MDDKKYQIFISSTYQDLIEAREKVTKSILNLYHLPVGMEMFSAGDDEQWDIIRDTIDTSDYYVLIIGHRYGSTTANGISYTEKEFDYAIERGIPVLAFIRERDVPTQPFEREENVQQDEKLAKFIEKASQRMRDTWNTPDDLANKVLIALSKEFKRHPRIGWIRADRSVSDEVLSEVARLSKENHDLREQVKTFTRVGNRYPKIVAKIDRNDRLTLMHYMDIQYEMIKPRTPLTMDDVPEEIRKYIKSVDLDSFNKKIPSVRQCDLYNQELRDFIWRKFGSSEIPISILNDGSLKANQIRVAVRFPPELLVMDKSEVNRLSAPWKPDIPNSDTFFYNVFMRSTLSGALGLKQEHDIYESRMPKKYKERYQVNYRKPKNDSAWTEDNTINIAISELIHTQSVKFDDFVLLPLQTGEFFAEVSVICEEYPQLHSFKIPFTVIQSSSTLNATEYEEEKMNS